MPLEFKNLKTNVNNLLKTHSDLNTEILKAQEHGKTAVSHAGDFGKAFQGIGRDLEFAATVLGNAGNDSESGSEKKEQTVTSGDTVKVIATPAGNVPISPKPVNNEQF